VNVKGPLLKSRDFFVLFEQKEECTKKIRELGSLPADAFEKHQKTPVKTVSCKLIQTNEVFCFVYCVGESKERAFI